MAKKRQFEYRKPSDETVKKRANQQGGAFDTPYLPKLTVWTPGEGDHRIRILPPADAKQEHYGIDVWLHSSVGPDQQTYLCKAKMAGKRCVVCEERARAIKDNDEKAAGDLNPYRRVAVFIIDRDKPKEGVQLYPMPWTMDRDITNLSIDKGSGEILYIDHPDNGFDVEFTRTGKGLNTKYHSIAIARRSSPLSDDDAQQDGWLGYIMENPLTECLNYYDDEHILKVFAGQKAKDDEDDDDGTPPKTRRERVQDDDEDDAPKRKKAPVDDDDDEPAPRKKAPVDDDEEDDDEPAPKRKKVVDDEDEELDRPKKGGVKPVDEDDDDADKAKAAKEKLRKSLADDDDDEPAPKKKKAPVDDDDDDDAPPPKRKKVVDDEDDDD